MRCGVRLMWGFAAYKVVTSADIKAVYAPLADPAFTGKATITSDQLTNLPVDKELVTAEWVSQHPCL